MTLCAGGFFISQQQARELTNISKDDLESCSPEERKSGQTGQAVPCMEILSSRGDNIQYLIATCYYDFTLQQLYDMDKSKLPQFIPDIKEESVQKFMAKSSDYYVTFDICFMHDYLVHPNIRPDG